MTIRVYSSVMPGEPAEVHEAHGLTIEQWVSSQTDDYKPGDQQPISVFRNGSRVEPGAWADTVIEAGDSIDVRVIPFGGVGDFFQSVAGFIVNPLAGQFFAGADAITDWITPDVRARSGSGQQGSNISAADARANTVRAGGIIPELFGYYIRYPDYLCQPVKDFVDTRNQALYLMLSVGKGKYQINTDTLKIGNTPVSDLGNTVDYQFFGPGEDVSGHPAHQNWYRSPEVGASTGSSGLRLKAGANYTQVLNASQYDFDGQDMTVPYGAGTVPSDWETGMVLEISILQDVTVVNSGTDSGGNYLPDVVQGDFTTFSVDDAITISGDSGIAGDYLVDSFTDGSPDEMTLRFTDLTPAVFLPAGTYRADADYTGVRYRIDAILTEQIQVGTEEVENPDPPPATIEQPVYATRRLGFTLTRLNPDGSEDAGWSGFTTQSTTDSIVLLDDSTLNGDWAGPYVVCPAGETITTFKWDTFGPQGLGEIDDDGNIKSRTRTVELQWREVGTTMWTSITHSISGATRDQLGWTFEETLPYPMRPEVRVRRTSAEDTSTSSLDRLEWYGLRAKLPAATSYPGVTTLAMTIEGSDTIANQSENQINLIAQRILEDLDGNEVATRGIAEAAAYIAKDAGYDSDQLDVDELKRLKAIWDARGDTFDHVFDATTAKAAIDVALRPGFAEFTIDTGMIKPVRDEPRTQFEQPYSPENMTGPLRRTFTGRKPDEKDGVEVEYTDGSTWTTETVLCTLPGDAATNVQKIKLEGVTSRTRAWRIGMRRRRAMRYRRYTYEFSTELDALNSQYLSYVPLIEDVPGYGKAAILQEIYSDRIVVSEPMEFQEGQSHVVAYRDEYGETIGPFPATQGSNEFELMVSIPEPWPDLTARQEPIQVFFGTTERWSFPALITEISPSGPLAVSVSATNYDERVYADDNNAPA